MKTALVFVALVALARTSVYAAIPSHELDRELFFLASSSTATATATTDFCQAIVGKWRGSCDVREGATTRTFDDVIEAGAFNECRSFAIGQDWIDVTRTEINTEVVPALASGTASRLASTQEFWRWGADGSSLTFEERRLDRQPLLSQQITEVTTRGKVSLEGDRLLRQFAFSDLRRTMTCSYSRVTGEPTLTAPGNLRAFLDTTSYAAAPVVGCADFSGDWRGHCVYIDERSHNEWDEDTVFEQKGCEAFRRDGVWTTVGAVKNRMQTYPSGANEILFTDLSTWKWSADRKRLENSGVEFGAAMNLGKLEELKSSGHITLQGEKLIQHRLAHGTCLFHCVYERRR